MGGLKTSAHYLEIDVTTSITLESNFFGMKLHSTIKQSKIYLFKFTVLSSLILSISCCIFVYFSKKFGFSQLFFIFIMNFYYIFSTTDYFGVFKADKRRNDSQIIEGSIFPLIEFIGSIFLFFIWVFIIIDKVVY